MNQVAQIQRDITDQVSTKVESLTKGGLALPKNYNYQNALKSAFFALNKVETRDKKPALQVCSRDSIANALLDMVTQGLTPAKTQCYFIAYGREIQLQRSYFGTITVLKSLDDIKDIYADVVHEDDKFEIAAEEGRMLIKDFEPKFQNLDKPLVGAFAVVERVDGQKIYTIMTKKQIDNSWSQAKTDKVQKKFPEEMAKRTVLDRAAKMFVNTSDDSNLDFDAIQRTTDNEFEDDSTETQVRRDISENANQTDFEPDKEEPKQIQNQPQMNQDSTVIEPERETVASKQDDRTEIEDEGQESEPF